MEPTHLQCPTRVRSLVRGTEGVGFRFLDLADLAKATSSIDSCGELGSFDDSLAFKYTYILTALNPKAPYTYPSRPVDLNSKFRV